MPLHFSPSHTHNTVFPRGRYIVILSLTNRVTFYATAVPLLSLAHKLIPLNETLATLIHSQALLSHREHPQQENTLLLQPQSSHLQMVNK